MDNGAILVGDIFMNCRMCKQTDLMPVIDFGKHPIAHHLLLEQSQEEYIHLVELYFCNNCGLIQLVNPISPEILYTNYYSLTSWKNQPYIPLIIEMMEQLPGFNKSAAILEVGCNDGIFLEALKERGYLNYLGIEPAKDAHEMSIKKGLNTRRAFFNQDTAEKIIGEQGKTDFFIARQVLEHIQVLEEFSKSMQMVLKKNDYVLIEVPNFKCHFDTLDYSIWEEHVNYFTFDTLRFFLANAGIKLLTSKTVVFSGEALLIIGRYVGKPISFSVDNYLPKLKSKMVQYKETWPKFKQEFRQFLETIKKDEKKIAVYGAGNKICSLINFCELGQYISFVVDDQLEKQNKFLPGSKLPIFSSKMLEQEKIDVCLLGVTRENEEKVINKHNNFLECGGIFYAILPPTDRLPPFWKEMLPN